jgi:hypothetical protein
MKKILLFACLCTPFLSFGQITPENTIPSVKLPATTRSQPLMVLVKSPPLLVVDDVIYSFKKDEEFQAKIKSIPVETIESVNVLKDKQATDEFGEKGANGVVIVKKKKA